MFAHNDVFFITEADVDKQLVLAEDFWGTLRLNIQYLADKAGWNVHCENVENGFSADFFTVAGVQSYKLCSGLSRRSNLVRGAKRAMRDAQKASSLYKTLVDCGGHKLCSYKHGFDAFESIIAITDSLYAAEHRFYVCDKNNIRGHDRAFFRHAVLEKYSSRPVATLLGNVNICSGGGDKRGAVRFNLQVADRVVRVYYVLRSGALRCDIQRNDGKWSNLVNVAYSAWLVTPDSIVEDCCNYLGLSYNVLGEMFVDERFLCEVI